MGLIESNNKRTIYLTISKGYLVKRVDKDTEGAVQRTTKEGKEVWELLYKGLEGIITNVGFKDHEEYGRDLQITVRDGIDIYMLQTKFSGSYAFGFLTKVENIDLLKPLTIKPYYIYDKEFDKNRSYLGIYQEGKKIQAKYTKDNPGGLPDLEVKKVKGKKIYDDSERLDFFEKMLNEKIIPALHIQPTAMIDISDGLSSEVLPPPSGSGLEEDQSRELAEKEGDLPF